MSLNKKLLWGGLGWVFAGPIGAVLGYTYASMSNNGSYRIPESSSSTKHGDFIISVLVLFAKVMKADGKLLKSELDYRDGNFHYSRGDSIAAEISWKNSSLKLDPQNEIDSFLGVKLGF